MRNRHLLAFLLSFCTAVWAKEPYRDFLPNLPSKPSRALESEQDFLSRCRDEEAYFFTKHTGLYYATALYNAAHGDPTALGSLFRVAPFQDGAGAEGFADTLFWIMHRVGDEKFFNALKPQSPKVRQRVIELIDFGASYDYSSAFPNTFRLAKHRPQSQ